MRVKRFYLGIVFGLILVLLMSCSLTLPWLKDLTPLEKAQAKKIYWGIKVIASEEEFKTFDTLFTIACQEYPYDPFTYQPFKDWWDSFWKRQDIDPTTEENERKEKWEKDVEYAITHYRSAFELCPWDDRGETYIKFGEPDEIETEVSPEKIIEIWHYFKGRKRLISLVFEETISGFKIKHDYQDPGEIMRASRNWTEVQQSRFAWVPPDLKLLPCAMQVQKFRDKMFDSTGKAQIKYDVYVNVLIPLKELGIAVDSLDSLYKYTLLQRIQILNENRKMIKADTSLITRRVRKELRENLLVLQKQFDLYPGIYTIYFSIQDTLTKKTIGYTREDYILAEYAQVKNSETISELCFASKVMPAKPGDEMFVRNDQLVVPMPSLTFLPDQSIFLYYEIYDLKVSDERKIKILKELYLYHGKREDKISTDTLFMDADTASSFSESDIYITEEFNAKKIIHLKDLGKNSLKKIPGYIENGKFEKGEYILVIRIIDLNDNSDKRERETVSGFKII